MTQKEMLKCLFEIYRIAHGQISTDDKKIKDIQMKLEKLMGGLL